MCDLQDMLDEALQLDFNIQAEDDSPYQVRGRHAGRPGASLVQQPGAAQGTWCKAGVPCCSRACEAKKSTSGTQQDRFLWHLCKTAV